MQEVGWGGVESAAFVIIMYANGWTLVFSDEDNKPYALCHNSSVFTTLRDTKEPTHCSKE